MKELKYFNIYIKKSIIVTIMLFVCCVGESSLYAKPKKEVKDTVKQQVNNTWLYSMVLPGYGQIRNKQYWKVPVIYASGAGLIYMGYDSNSKYHEAYNNYVNTTDPSLRAQYKSDYTSFRRQRNLYYSGAGLVYLLSVIDAINGVKSPNHSPAKATLYSALLPGLGQFYNKQYWKIPIIYGGMASLIYGITFNNTEYKSALDAYNAVKAGEYGEFNGATKEADLKHYVQSYRRNRDLMVLLIGVAYALNIIDATVDAHLFDYDIGDDLSLRFDPMMTNDFTAPKQVYSYTGAGVGARVLITF
ncbi:MAG: DUF5683 domain-containing protein [Bacteroidales bacterium]|nr:DUF5683 domain-containing protein [Bacteroidales bacterium]